MALHTGYVRSSEIILRPVHRFMEASQEKDPDEDVYQHTEGTYSNTMDIIK